MRILIAYDGSTQADLVFEDLQRAGLPAEAHVLIFTVVEARLAEFSAIKNVPSRIHAVSQEAAQAIADKPVAQLSARFPSWRIQAEGAHGAPVRRILERAVEWKADLIALSAIGHSAMERILIGSVSQKVSNEAQCSVRIARGRTPPPDLSRVIVVGYDGLSAARRATQRVADRSWPAGTTVILHTAVGFGDSPVADLVPPEDRDLIRGELEPVVKLLKDAGLRVETSIVEDDPKNSIVSVAEKMVADCIFIGDNDESILGRWFLGTVASAVVPRARCSVEIVR